MFLEFFPAIAPDMENCQHKFWENLNYHALLIFFFFFNLNVSFGVFMFDSISSLLKCMMTTHKNVPLFPDILNIVMVSVYWI